MTATPIPRTLVLTYFGDMDISELREKPAGRQPIDTRTLPIERLDEVVDAIGRALSEGRRVYWVCPLVEESEKSDLAAAEDRFAELKQKFGALDRPRPRPHERRGEGCRHGALRRRRDPLLVATTVIEVGVDVPEATVMVIEHAERFGLVAAASVARPHRPRLRALDLPPALPPAARRDREGAARDHAPDRGRLPDRGGGFAAARRRRRARHAAIGRAGIPDRPHRDPRQPDRHRARRRAACAVARSHAVDASAARRCATCSMCSGATRRSG